LGAVCQPAKHFFQYGQAWYSMQPAHARRLLQDFEQPVQSLAV